MSDPGFASGEAHFELVKPQAAEQRIRDEQTAARDTIPEVAGEVTRAAVERLTGESVADADIQKAVNTSSGGGA